MASAALDWDSFGEIGESIVSCRSDLRADEESVRILLIEDRPQFAHVVSWALDRAARGHFEVEEMPVLDVAAQLLVECEYDAILLDLGERTGDSAHEAMDAAEALAHRVPVIVLTGTCFEGLTAVTRDDELAALVAREHLCCDRLPCAILDAIHRHRRVGQRGADPIIYHMHP